MQMNLCPFIILASQMGNLLRRTFIYRTGCSNRDIYNTMSRCGLTHDEGPDVGGPVGPYIQSERRDLYGKYAELLVRRGGAYHCFCQKQDEEPAEGL